MTASDYLANAHDAIDKRFGEGFAPKNTQLVAAFMEVAAPDFNTSSTAKVLEFGLQRLADSLTAIADSLHDSAVYAPALNTPSG